MQALQADVAMAELWVPPTPPSPFQRRSACPQDPVWHLSKAHLSRVASRLPCLRQAGVCVFSFGSVFVCPDSL